MASGQNPELQGNQPRGPSTNRTPEGTMARSQTAMLKTLLFFLLSLVLFSCAFIPGATVRVALPLGDSQAQSRWEAVLAALPPTPGAVTVETVAPDAFPPADLVWFDGNLDNEAYRTKALGTNAQVDALAKDSGIPAGWFGVEGDRILPLAWAPWSWWVAPGHPAPALGGNPLVPYADQANLRALALGTARVQGPTLGGDPVSAVWFVWGARTRDEGKTLTAAQGLTLWAPEHHDRVWLGWAALPGASGETDLVPEPAKAAPTRAIGFWWNADGWNRNQVPKLLARLWSKEAQAVWLTEPGWLPVNGTVPVSERGRTVQDWGQKTGAIFVVGER